MAAKDRDGTGARVSRRLQRRPPSVASQTRSTNVNKSSRVDGPSTANPSHRKLEIDVVWSDIKSVEADVFLVGHYLGVLPQTAELELDRLVSGRDDDTGGKLIITELTRRGALRGDLGELILFPGPSGRVVALGGMGRLEPTVGCGSAGSCGWTIGPCLRKQ
jgi:hypothetical protein